MRTPLLTNPKKWPISRRRLKPATTFWRLKMKIAGSVAIVLAVISLLPTPAGAQADLSGFWNNVNKHNLTTALDSNQNQKPHQFNAYGQEKWRTVDTSKEPNGIC